MKRNIQLEMRMQYMEANRCLLCEDPVCSKACKQEMSPARMIRALKMGNEAGAAARALGMEACGECTAVSCQKACLRGRLDRSVEIRAIREKLAETAREKASVCPETPLPGLSVQFCGIRCENPFILASSPVAHNYEMCARALEAGWAGVCFKTISYYPAREVSPRFDQVECDGVPFVGFKNMEQLSEAPIPANFETLFRLKQEYPTKLIIISIMGQTEEEWTNLARFSTQAGADVIECNFSCPQMTKEGMGSDVGQDADLVYRFTSAACRGTNRPVIAKMTPNIGRMAPVARAALAGGASGLAAINTIKSITRVDADAFTALPVIQGKSSVSGYSGKAVRPVALRFIHELASDPVISRTSLSGIGGIETWRDALDFLLLGCSNLQVCTSVMQYGYRIIEDLTEGLQRYMQQKGFRSLSELQGLATKNITAPEQLDRVTAYCAAIDRDRCIGCGRCYISCNDGGHQAILFPPSRKAEVNEAKCVGCLLCSLVCPALAIGKKRMIPKEPVS